MKHSKTTLLLLTPSWISNLLGVLLGLGLTIGTIILTNYQGSQLQQEIFEVHKNAANANTGTSTYQNITNNLAHNSVLSDAPLFILWAFVGLIVYYFAISIVNSLGHIEELREEMDYVNASRRSLIRHAVGELLLRLIALAGWFVFIKVSLDTILPQALDAAHTAAGGLTLSHIGYGLLATAIVYIDIYVHTLFLRIVTLKPRVFSK